MCYFPCKGFSSPLLLLLFSLGGLGDLKRGVDGASVSEDNINAYGSQEQYGMFTVREEHFNLFLATLLRVLRLVIKMYLPLFLLLVKKQRIAKNNFFYLIISAYFP